MKRNFNTNNLDLGRHPNTSSTHYFLNTAFASFINLKSKKKYSITCSAEFLLVSNTGAIFTQKVRFLAS